VAVPAELIQVPERQTVTVARPALERVLRLFDSRDRPGELGTAHRFLRPLPRDHSG
jgi:hypothetical protein